MLKIVNVTKTFNKGTVNEKVALKNLNLHVKKGDFITIIGSNGAGKSTMFNAICGAFIPDEGYVELDGEDITFKTDYKRAVSIGYLHQDPMKGTAANMTIEENIAFGLKIKKKSKDYINDKIKKIQTNDESLNLYYYALFSIKEELYKECLKRHKTWREIVKVSADVLY